MCVCVCVRVRLFACWYGCVHVPVNMSIRLTGHCVCWQLAESYSTSIKGEHHSLAITVPGLWYLLKRRRLETLCTHFDTNNLTRQRRNYRQGLHHWKVADLKIDCIPRVHFFAHLHMKVAIARLYIVYNKQLYKNVLKHDNFNRYLMPIAIY